ncbi:soluble lytic murein transglycosylase-like protein [Salinibacter ruber]|uniref:lytic transglycosylase domain-containing protein n=1 Tax=Salinibacter ruber TaxID=146919 RepID=UPI002169F4F7|nr:lytic transglycosylase domain-containing protein [Salinibacter ruber]MCS3862621.1 soluble lytic murein transglycosylase-like protein [Salinibacter ruber]
MAPNTSRLLPRAFLAGGALFLLAALGAVPVVLPAWAQKGPHVDAHVRHVAQNTRPKAPARSTRRRLRDYDSYVRYFSGLAYTRSGVNLSTNFVRALIAAESAARPRAVSSAGAIGLLQIRPETGRRAARALYDTGYEFRFVDRRRLRRLSADDLKDPALNILIGCYLLDRYNAAFGDHLARTVGAWNAGPDRVRQYRGTPPYEETVGLIRRVNAFYLFFRRQDARAP